jgi:hypothetical protein
MGFLMTRNKKSLGNGNEAILTSSLPEQRNWPYRWDELAHNRAAAERFEGAGHSHDC